ncbi:pseudouridine synthase [Chitinimonas lacunae]|uniref:Pseudouridine synthase n=1 Tax=Chitinimonas lacunae TaxID=1963018 RepID=A0ABV8MSF7_9NEIS
MKLERLLQSQGFGSRKGCRLLIQAGRLTVAGEPWLDPELDLDETGWCFEVDGEPWQYRERVYLALHKPAGVECSRTPQHHASVFGLLPLPLRERGVQCVGRLDQDTTGLLLLSDDGSFIHGLASPRRHVSKCYHAAVRHPLDASQLAALREGVQLHDEPAPLAALGAEALDERLLALTIDQGKYHQVKRMVAAAGNRVEALHRVALGGLVLGEGGLADLAPGQWRYLERDALLALGVDGPWLS